MLEHPEQVSLLRQEPTLLSNAVEECLRFRPPTLLFSRTAKQDIVIDGQQIKKGEWYYFSGFEGFFVIVRILVGNQNMWTF